MTRQASTDTELTAAIATERRDLAELLAGLPPAAWDADTLCAGWRVREVVAHITMPFRYSALRFGREMIRSRGNFNRMADRCARRDARMPTGELVATLRENEYYPWKPPGGGLAGALTHDVIHGLDITVPLGTGRRVPEDSLRMVLESVAKPKTTGLFGVDLAGIQLVADDLDWSFGSGTPLSGQAQDLALVLCGRKLPAGHLHGEPGTRFTAG